jgi:hypothetical protein
MIKLLHLMTVAFVVLKVAAIGAVATWSWWTVAMPSIVAVGLGGLLILIGLALVWLSERK